GNVQAGDRGVVDTVEVLDDGAQGVAVRRQQDNLARLQIRDDLLLPVRQGPLQHVLETFRVRDGLTGIPVVGVLGVLAAGLDRRRRHIVGAPPGHELLLAELVTDLLLVLALQGAVVPLVQAPGTLDVDPVPFGDVQGEVRGGDGAAQQGGVNDVRQDAGVHHQLPTAAGFVHPVGRQGHVHPSGAEALGIPFTLAVAEQYELVGHGSSVPHHRHYSVTGTTPREPAEDSLPAQQDYFAGALFRAGEPRSGPRAAFRAGGACSHRFLRNSRRQDARW